DGVKYHRFGLGARFALVVPAWPNIGLAVYGQSLNAGWLFEVHARVPFAICFIDLLVDCFDVGSTNLETDCVAIAREWPTVMIASPNRGGEYWRNGHNPGVFRLAVTVFCGTSLGAKLHII